jgi:hypothetical protein
VKDILHLAIENLSRPITLINCRDLVDHFPVILPGWEFNEVFEISQPSILTLRFEDATYILQGGWLKEPKIRKDRLAAICALVAELVRAYVNDDAKLLCLHGAAADFAGKLVIFPNKYRAGKSILSACLAATNVKLFGDDVLPISLLERYGIAPGLAPRLRSPLPENLDAESRHFIEANAALKSNQYIYLDLKDDTLATRYSRAPIGAFVLLEREEGIDPVLDNISESEVLRQVVWQNFARETEAPQILECLSQIVANAKRYCLRYDRAEDAVVLLKETFKEWPENLHEPPPRPYLSEQIATNPADLSPGCFLRKPDIREVTVDGESFLADARGAAIHQLNAVGSAIWTLLAEPTTIDEMIELLLVAFPEVGRDQVEADICELVNALKSKNLLTAKPNS